MSKEQKSPQLDRLSTLLSMIRNSEGCGMYRQRFYYVWGESMDVLFDGDVACAATVSPMLWAIGLMKEFHTKVSETIRDMEECGWHKIPHPRPGALIHWDFKKKGDGTLGVNHHLGFYLDEETAVSNDAVTGVLARHHPTFGEMPNGEPRREILAYYWHSWLGKP